MIDLSAIVEQPPIGFIRTESGLFIPEREERLVLTAADYEAVNIKITDFLRLMAEQPSPSDTGVLCVHSAPSPDVAYLARTYGGFTLHQKKVYGKKPEDDKEILVLGIPLNPGARAAITPDGRTLEQEILGLSEEFGVKSFEISGNYLPLGMEPWERTPSFVKKVRMDSISSPFDPLYVDAGITEQELKTYFKWRLQSTSGVLGHELADALFYAKDCGLEPATSRNGDVLPAYGQIKEGDYLVVMPWQKSTMIDMKDGLPQRFSRAWTTPYLLKVLDVKENCIDCWPQDSLHFSNDAKVVNESGRLFIDFRTIYRDLCNKLIDRWARVDNTNLYDYAFEVFRVVMMHEGIVKPLSLLSYQVK